MLFFPNRSLVLEIVDRILASCKGFAPMGAAHGHDDADFSNGEVAGAMVDHDAIDIRPLLANLLGQLFENIKSHGLVGLVFQR